VFQLIYDIPTWLLGMLIVGTFTTLSILGLFATRPLIRWVMGPSPGHSQGVDVFVHAAVLIYGLITGLVAVGVWEQFSSANERVNEEANSLAALYRDAEFYPQPRRATLTRDLRTYTRYVIEVAWPLQREGIVPNAGVNYVDAFQKTLYGFEPKTAGQTILATTTVAEFNRYVELRRARLDATNTGLPSSLWSVIIIGAAITIFLTYFLALERWAAHIILTCLVAVIISLLIFVIVVHNHPFRGNVSIGPGAFELLYQQLMQPR
jgi:hypothetical protein